VKRRLPGLGRSEPPPESPPGPSEQDALVPVGPPRRPQPSSAAVVELPSEPDPLVYPIETDAVGRELPEDEEDSDYGASAAL
jgi:hypothetical protein